MLGLTFITGNNNKYQEFKYFLPDLLVEQLDLPEIQSSDIDDVVMAKLEHASKHISKPVLVEDTSLELDALNGLPGPFVKYFEQKLGLSGIFEICDLKQNYTAKARTIVGLNINGKKYYFEGAINGTICQPVGNNGFGWDEIFMPAGQNKSFAELEYGQKQQISMRSIALGNLVNFLHANE